MPCPQKSYEWSDFSPWQFYRNGPLIAFPTPFGSTSNIVDGIQQII